MPLRRAGAEFPRHLRTGFRRSGIGGDRRRGDRQPRRGVRVRALAAGDGLRDRPDLGLPHQPGGHAGLVVRSGSSWRGGPLLDRAVLGAIVAPGAVRSSSRRAPAAMTSREGFGANGYGAHSPGGFPVGARADRRDGADLLPRVHGAPGDRPDRRRRLRRHPDRPRADADPPGRHPGRPTCRSTPRAASGPAIFVGGWAIEQLWLFIVAPLLGALLGAIVHRFLFTGPARRSKSEESAVAATT